MRILFAGTPEFAALHLKALLEAKFDVIGVYTQPDRQAGRGKKLTPSAVKQLALEHNIEVHQPASLKSAEAQTSLAALKPDVFVVVAYGLILPKAVLDIPKFGCINVHGSILPKWRGAAPIQRSIWAGDERTGVTIMQMDEGLDTGDILTISEVDIAEHETSASLYEKLAKVGPEALVNTLKNHAKWQAQTQNDDDASYAAKLSKDEAKINWSLGAQQLERNVRAFNPWPIVWFEHASMPIKVWEAEYRNLPNLSQKLSSGEILQYDKLGLFVACHDGVLVIHKIQKPGKKPQSIEQIYNGQKDLFSVGQVLR